MAILVIIGAVLAAIGIWHCCFKMLGQMGSDIAGLASKTTVTSQPLALSALRDAPGP